MADQLKRPRTFVKGLEAERVFYAAQDADFVFGRGTALFAKAPVEISGCTHARVVSDAGENWFEFGFRIDTILLGNGAAGWTDLGNYLQLDPQWSPDLTNWSMGKFVPAPVPTVDLGDGTFEYWSRALNPQDAAVKLGAITCASTVNSGDSRNNPFTGITIAGTLQTLPNYPYTMPTHAAQLQTDLRAAGWTGATVSASSAIVWSIVIPSVNFTAYSQDSLVSWAAYTITDAATGTLITISSWGFSGSFVDAAGTPIFPKAFARLKISGGSRYNPWH